MPPTRWVDEDGNTHQRFREVTTHVEKGEGEDTEKSPYQKG